MFPLPALSKYLVTAVQQRSENQTTQQLCHITASLLLQRAHVASTRDRVYTMWPQVHTHSRVKRCCHVGLLIHSVRQSNSSKPCYLQFGGKNWKFPPGLGQKVTHQTIVVRKRHRSISHAIKIFRILYCFLSSKTLPLLSVAWFCICIF